jgi:hypothetical protein
MAESTASFDPNDPMQLALKIVQQDGVIASMQQAFTASQQNLTSAIQGLQSEVRDLGKGISVIGKLETERQAHSEGLARAFEAIAKAEAMHEQAWERHNSQEAIYRERCEAERKAKELKDEADRKTTELEEDSYRLQTAKDHKSTRDTMIRWSGVSIGVSLLLGFLVSTVTYIYISDKTNNSRDMDALRVKIDLRIKEVDESFKEVDERFDKIEQVLVRQCAEQNRPCEFR